MSGKAFSTVVDALLQRLGIRDEVDFSEQELVLEVDGVDVVLRDGVDGRTLLVEGPGGALDVSSVSKRSRIEKLLKTNLALSTVHNTISVLVGDAEDTAKFVNVRGFYRYQQNDINVLTDLVSDVASSADILRGVLTNLETEVQYPNVSDRSENELIFLSP